MTELQMLLSFLISIQDRFDVKNDIIRLQKLLNYVYVHEDTQAFVSFLEALLQLDDAIRAGLNTGRFNYERTDVFSRYPKSCLPKFLRGVLSLIYSDEGDLLEDYSIEALRVIEGLCLPRRAQFSTLTKAASEKAVEKFVSYQRESRYLDPEICEQMRQSWGFFAPESRFHDHLRLGFPGNGVTTNMEFPYVPQLTFPDFRTCPDSQVRSLLFDALGRRLQSDAFAFGFPDSQYVKVYPFIPSPRISPLAVVPKTALIGRAITVTDVFSASLAATLRETLFSIVDSYHMREFLNVHDQTISHETLFNDFDSTCNADLEGGSSTLTLELLDGTRVEMTNSNGLPEFEFKNRPNDDYSFRFTKTWEGILPDYLQHLWRLSRPDAVETPSGEVVPLSTLTMGDGSSVALLTCTLGLVLVNAVFNHFCRRHGPTGLAFTRERWLNAVEFILNDGRFHVVGDDMVYPAEFEHEVRRILCGIGVTINEKKTSSAEGRYHETCGAWGVRDKNGLVHRFYPFRCPDKTASLSSRQQATQAFILRSISSPISRDLASAVTVNLPFDDLHEYLSYDLSAVGSPYGKTEPRFGYRTFTPEPADLPDELSFAFQIDPLRCFPRETRRPLVPKIGYSRLRRASHLPFISYSRIAKKQNFLQQKARAANKSDACTSHKPLDLEFCVSLMAFLGVATVFS